MSEWYYNGISVYWKLKEFMELYGDILTIRKLRNKKGDFFPLCVFENKMGETTATFYRRIVTYCKEDVMEHVDDWMVGLRKENGKFIIFSDAWPKIVMSDIKWEEF